MSWLTTRRARELDIQYREFLSGNEYVTKGARVLPILVDPFEGSRDVSPFWSFASSYQILRGGANPYVFARPYIKTGASPVAYLKREVRFAYQCAECTQFQPEKSAPDYRGVSCCYDYVLLWGSSAAIEAVLKSELTLVYQTDHLRVFRTPEGAGREVQGGRGLFPGGVRTANVAYLGRTLGLRGVTTSGTLP